METIILLQETLSIHEKINAKTFEKRFFRSITSRGLDGLQAFYDHLLWCKSRSGNYGGGTWEQPLTKEMQNDINHVESRYIDEQDEAFTKRLQRQYDNSIN